MLPLGAKPRRSVYPEAPPSTFRQDPFSTLGESGDAGNGKKKTSSSARPKSSRGGDGITDLVFDELEQYTQRYPALKSLLDFLRFRYSVEVRPSSPAWSSLSILGMVASLSVASSVRQLIAWLPFISLELKRSVLEASFLTLLVDSGTLGDIVLFVLGSFVGALARNRFSMNALFCNAWFLLGFSLVVASGTGKTLLFGEWVGTWLHFHVVHKEPALERRKRDTPQPRGSVPGGGPVAAEWVHERWLPGAWEMLTGGGAWVPLPTEAQQDLERAHAEHAPSARLQVGESTYRVNLVQLVATNEDSNAERRVRRQTGKA